MVQACGGGGALGIFPICGGGGGGTGIGILPRIPLVEGGGGGLPMFGFGE